MFDPARYDPPLTRPDERPRRWWRPSRPVVMLSRAVAWVVVGLMLMPFMLHPWEWVAWPGGIYLALWAAAGATSVPALRAVSWFVRGGWRRCERRRVAAWAGFLLVLVIAVHAVWFRYGWMDFRPPCVRTDGVTREEVELVGTMTEPASRALYDVFRKRWGEHVVRLTVDGRLQMRPGLAMFLVEDHRLVVDRLVADLPPEPGMAGVVWSDCDRSALRLMTGGWAYWSFGWRYWPYTMVDGSGLLGRWLSATGTSAP
jgi:hypothetical protein